MSAVGVLDSESVRTPPPSARPRLHLVASNGQLSLGGRLGGEESALGERLPALRLTRQGRLVITVVAAVVAATLAVLLATTVHAAAAQIDHVIIVSAGLSLSEISATQLPSLPIQDGVTRIQLANDLNTSQVHAGQSLVIPALS